MKVTLLGTGTPSPSLKRQGSGYVVETGDDMIVFDHGPGAHQRFLESGRRAVDVTHLFFSHLHYDHCVDYPRLLLTRWDQGAGTVPDLKVYGPPPIARMTEQLFGEGGVYSDDLRARTEHEVSVGIYRERGGTPPRAKPKPVVRELAPGDIVRDGNWTLTLAEGWHVEPYLKCYGYRLEADGQVFCYAGDSGGVCPEIVELARGADVLVHMNHYFSGTEPNAAYRRACGNHIDTATVARDAGVGAVVLTHMLNQIDQPRIRERMVREMAAIFDGDIIIGEDLMDIPMTCPSLDKMD